jgi:transcriptional regulator with GAF, ATPase, and Fis domain
LRINHFGDINHLHSYSLTELFKTYDQFPDSLDFKDKLVLVAVSASGVANLKATPLSSSLPASLIHATVAENIMTQNFINSVSLPVHWLFILLMGLVALLIHSIKTSGWRLGIFLVGIPFYLIFCLLIFKYTNTIFPLFFPLVAYGILFIIGTVVQLREQKFQEESIKSLLDEQISLKESELDQTRDQLSDIEHELAKNKTISEQSRSLAAERKETIRQLEKELNDLRTYTSEEKQDLKSEFHDIIYAPGSGMEKVLEMVTKVSTDDIPVLIMGETGTGKEMVARAIHDTSNRKNAPFVAVNCGALSETLLESELFGHEKGSFTGAQNQRKGRFELANGGSIFLDEITETTPAFQARLLRVLQDNSFERVGGEQTLKTDIRIIAATNKDISVEMKNDRFRADLFYRLNGFPITLPSLQDRPQDIPLLLSHFLIKHNFNSIAGASDQAMQIMKSYAWPGNVRELENCIRRAAILAQSDGRDMIREPDLPDELSHDNIDLEIQTIHKPIEHQILEMLRSLKFSHNSISQTARALGNKDRGTITEHFRGLCFEYLVETEYDRDKTAALIAASEDQDVMARVRDKIDEYLDNLQPYLAGESANITFSSIFKGLPKKYHSYLQQVLDYLASSQKNN